MTFVQIAMYVVDAALPADLQCHIRPGAGACCALVRWEQEAPPVDAGPPPVVEELLAAALVQCGTLAFLAEPEPAPPGTGWSEAREGFWLRIPPTLADRVRRRLPPWMLATNSAEHARQVFEGAVSWNQQHQVGFLLRPGRLPALGRALVIEVMAARDAPIATLGLPDEVIALVLPAVDGDYLEIVARNAATRTQIVGAIVGECDRRSVPFHHRPLADLGPTPSSCA